jgi:hypothetical protein
MKIEVGKTYKLNNDRVYKCTEMFGDNPKDISDKGYGPFVIDGFRYHQDGTFGSGDASTLDVACEYEPGQEVKKWEHLSPARKGELLLARHDGKPIQYSEDGINWFDADYVALRAGKYYRVKPEVVEPKVETVTLVGSKHIDWWFASGESKLSSDEYAITFTTKDGVPDCSSVKMEKVKNPEKDETPLDARFWRA